MGQFAVIKSDSVRTQIFTASGTFKAPAGITKVYISMIGGGGSGNCGYNSGATTSRSGAGGSSGAYCIKLPFTVIAGNNYTVTVGAGGICAGVGDPNGEDGADSVFDSLTVKGGKHGGADNNVDTYVASNPSPQAVEVIGGAGRKAENGSGATTTPPASAHGSGSVFGNGGEPANTPTIGYGGGGGGGAYSTAGAVGANGVVIVEW